VDVIAKLRELAAFGDKDAQKELRKYDKAIEQNDVRSALDFENNILELASGKMQLISEHEKERLEWLRKDRHVSVHPAFHEDGDLIEVKPEVVFGHLATAHGALLSRSATRGKVYLEKLFPIIIDRTFPKDAEAAFAVLSSRSNLASAKTATIRNLVIMLLKHICSDEISLEGEIDRCAAALTALERMSPSIVRETVLDKLEGITSGLSGDCILNLLPLCACNSEFWHRLGSPVQTRILAGAKEFSASEVLTYRIVLAAEKIPEISEVLLEAYEDFGREDQDKVLSFGPSSVLLNHAIDRFSNAGTFRTAELLGEKVLLRHAPKFTVDDLKRLFDKVFDDQKASYNQILDAAGMDKIFCQLAEITILNDEGAAEVWRRFFEEISKEYVFDELRRTLEGLGVSGLPEGESIFEDGEEEEEEIPF
jgi:hypothetical protein